MSGIDENTSSREDVFSWRIVLEFWLMKPSIHILSKQLVIAGILIALPQVAGLAETSALPPHREITIWVDAPTGSLIGSGYASSYLTNIRAKSTANEEEKLRRAIDTLDALGMVRVKGLGLVPAAVAWQSQVPIRSLIEQQAKTDLSYGELLMANSLATKSGQSFDQIVAMRAKSQTWGELAKQLGVDLDFVIMREHIAATRIRAVDARVRRGARHGRDPRYVGVNPHIAQRAERY